MSIINSLKIDPRNPFFTQASVEYVETIDKNNVQTQWKQIDLFKTNTRTSVSEAHAKSQQSKMDYFSVRYCITAICTTCTDFGTTSHLHYHDKQRSTLMNNKSETCVIAINLFLHWRYYWVVQRKRFKEFYWLRTEILLIVFGFRMYIVRS